LTLSHIVAAARNGVIGRNNELLWHLPNDFKFFKNTTSGHPVIMGRKTFQSIGRPLPGRTNIIITRDASFSAEGCEVFSDPGTAIARAFEIDPDPFIIGGADIYRQTIGQANRVYLTEVGAEPEGDAFFPALSPEEWRLTWSEAHPADEKHQYPYTFKLYERIV
jgi:dihydrofolate reductase